MGKRSVITWRKMAVRFAQRVRSFHRTVGLRSNVLQPRFPNDRAGKWTNSSGGHQPGFGFPNNRHFFFFSLFRLSGGPSWVLPYDAPLDEGVQQGGVLCVYTEHPASLRERGLALCPVPPSGVEFRIRERGGGLLLKLRACRMVWGYA